MTTKVSSRLPGIMSSPHFWLIGAMMVTGTIFHYAEQIGIAGTEFPNLHFGLTRHAMDRIIFLLPITYAGYIFGMKGGLSTLSVAFLVMLPRAILISPNRPDALLETVSVILVGGLVILWFEGQRREKEHRQQVILKLETAQQELQSHVQVIKTNEERLAALNTVSVIVSQSLNLQDILKAATDKVIEVMNADAALIFLLDEQGQELELEIHRGVSGEFAAGVGKMKVGEGLNGRVAQSGEPLLVEDASHDPRMSREAVKREGLQAQLTVPLKSKGKVMGTLCVAMRRPRQFSNDEVQLLYHVGNHIGVAIENAHLYQKERSLAEQLRVSERNYRELFENAHDAIWVQDLEGGIIATNEACAQLTGYTQEEIAHMNVRQFLSEDDLNIARGVRHKLLHGQALDQPYEQRLIRKDGTQIILKLTTSLITSGGQPRAFQHIARDITEEKRMEDNLRFYLQQVTRAQEEERKRIARELHDDTAQELVALSRRLDSITSNAEQLPIKDATLLEQLREQTDKILEGVRRFSQDLRPSILDDLGLLPALEWLTSDLTNHFGINIGMAVLGAERRFPPEAELLFFRIAQEALRNVWRHSEASRAWITLEFGDDETTLTITDNGKGFELPQRLGDLASMGKLGLAGMQERARLLGGTLKIQSELGKGTTVTVEVPQ